MERKRHVDAWLLNANFDSAVSQWTKTPDSERFARQVEVMIEMAKGAELTVKIKKDVLNRYGERNVIDRKSAADYGEVEGEHLIFRTGREVKARVGRIKTETFLVIETNHNEKFFFRPQDLVSLSVK